MDRVDATMAPSKTERFEPNRAVLLKDTLDPNSVCIITDAVAPHFRCPKIDAALENRLKPRKLHEEPQCTKFNSEILEPKREKARRENEDPM